MIPHWLKCRYQEVRLEEAGHYRFRGADMLHKTTPVDYLIGYSHQQCSVCRKRRIVTKIRDVSWDEAEQYKKKRLSELSRD